MQTIWSEEDKMTTSYHFIIDSYWDKKEQFPNESFIESPSFKAGDYFWRLRYYPNGASLCNTDHISVFIALRNRVATPVKACVTFSLLDRKGEPVPDHSISTDVQEYPVRGDWYGCHQFIKEYLEASEHLVKGCITIRCDVSVERETPFCGLHDTLAPNDIAFLVAGAVFGAHRCVFAARSQAFAAELSGWDKTRRCISIDGISVPVFQALVQFVYTDALPEMNQKQELMMGEDLLAAADRFDLPELKQICAEIFYSDINENTVAKMLDLTMQHRCQMLHEFCIEFLENHPTLDAVMANDDGFLLENVAKSCPETLEWSADFFDDDSI